MSPLHSVIYKKLYLLILFIKKKRLYKEGIYIYDLASFTTMLIVIMFTYNGNKLLFQ